MSCCVGSIEFFFAKNSLHLEGQENPALLKCNNTDTPHGTVPSQHLTLCIQATWGGGGWTCITLLPLFMLSSPVLSCTPCVSRFSSSCALMEMLANVASPGFVGTKPLSQHNPLSPEPSSLPCSFSPSQSVSSRAGSCLHHCSSSQLSYSCPHCLSSHTDKVCPCCCASPGQQSTQRPPSAAVSIRLYQMLHSLCQPRLLRDELISSSTWCARGRSRHPWGTASHAHTHTHTQSLGWLPGQP